MATANVSYLGELRTEATHLQSGNTILTDAPLDNQGKGEAFSPTDLVATALVSCMISIMGIAERNKGLNMGKVTGSVEKIMSANPRRIARLNVVLTFENHTLTEEQQEQMKKLAWTCPVKESLHPDIELNVDFVF